MHDISLKCIEYKHLNRNLCVAYLLFNFYFDDYTCSCINPLKMSQVCCSNELAEI